MKDSSVATIAELFCPIDDTTEPWGTPPLKALGEKQGLSTTGDNGTKGWIETA